MSVPLTVRNDARYLPACRGGLGWGMKLARSDVVVLPPNLPQQAGKECWAWPVTRGTRAHGVLSVWIPAFAGMTH